MKKKYKQLAIISDCIHVRNADGSVSTENHIYCRQMQALAIHFEKTLIVCPFVAKSINSVTTTYEEPSIHFLPLPNAGGNSWRDKLQLIRMIPVWLKAFATAYKEADIFYLRMPNNLSIPGFFYFKLKHARAFASYTGTWNNYTGEPFTYRLQKWILRYLFNGPVWVYSNKPGNKTNLFSSISPSFSEAEWNYETIQVEEKKLMFVNKQVVRPVFITVGALVPNKNQQYVLDVCKHLREMNISFYWYIVGDGFLRSHYEQFVTENQLGDYVCIAGKKTYEALQVIYRKSNFIVQSSLVEGFGKAPIEAMCHGVIPLLSKTAMSEEMTANGLRGYTFDVADPYSLIHLITGLLDEQTKLSSLIDNGRRYVKEQTLELWAANLADKVDNWTKY